MSTRSEPLLGGLAPTFLARLGGTLLRATRESRFILHARGKVRRFMLVHFRPGWVKHQLELRRGSCRRCGTCCNLLHTCPMLSVRGRCFVYGICRPQSCRMFPLDQRDLDEVRLCGGRCGFSFEAVATPERTGGPNDNVRDSAPVLPATDTAHATGEHDRKDGLPCAGRD